MFSAIVVLQSQGAVPAAAVPPVRHVPVRVGQRFQVAALAPLHRLDSPFWQRFQDAVLAASVHLAYLVVLVGYHSQFAVSPTLILLVHSHAHQVAALVLEVLPAPVLTPEEAAPGWWT